MNQFLDSNLSGNSYLELGNRMVALKLVTKLRNFCTIMKIKEIFFLNVDFLYQFSDLNPIGEFLSRIRQQDGSAEIVDQIKVIY